MLRSQVHRSRAARFTSIDPGGAGRYSRKLARNCGRLLAARRRTLVPNFRAVRRSRRLACRQDTTQVNVPSLEHQSVEKPLQPAASPTPAPSKLRSHQEMKTVAKTASSRGLTTATGLWMNARSTITSEDPRTHHNQLVANATV